ncbi:MAG: hypothetical protein ABI949_16680 [Ilumatobacteraceae bacterium]
MNKKLAGTGLAIGLIAGAGAGLILEISGNAGAASGNSVTAAAAAVDATSDTTANTGTTAKDNTADAPRPDPTTKLGEVLKPLVDDGTITQDQADKVIAAIVAARPARGDGGPMGGHRGPGGGFGIFGGPGIIGQGLDVVATTLGITADEVRTALESGQTVADLAVSKGKTAQDVIDAVVAEATTKINGQVAAGKVTQAQADKLIAGLTTVATDFVNNGFPMGLPGLGGHGGFGGRHGDDNDANADAPTDTTAPATTVG